MENIILEFAQFDPVTLGIIAGGKVASGVYNWFKGKRNPIKRTMSPEEARFRSQLHKRSTEGVYDAGNMREIISRVGRSASEVADKGRQFALGMLQGQGLGKSAVGQQIANKYNTQVSRAVSDSARDTAIANIGTKIQAQDQLGRIGMNDTERNYQQKIRERAEKDKYYDKAFGDLVVGVTDYATGIRAGIKPEDNKGYVQPKTKWGNPNENIQASIPEDVLMLKDKEAVVKWIQSQDDPQKALEMLLLLSGI